MKTEIEAQPAAPLIGKKVIDRVSGVTFFANVELWSETFGCWCYTNDNLHPRVFISEKDLVVCD